MNKEFVNTSCVTTHDTLVSDDQNENMKVGWSLGNGLLLEFHNVIYERTCVIVVTTTKLSMEQVSQTSR